MSPRLCIVGGGNGPMSDDYFFELTRWQPELFELRRIVLEEGLEETIKWKQPCYMDNGKNILILSPFNHHATLNLFKGAFIDDTQHLLHQPGENTQEPRQMRFTSVNEILEHEHTIRSYIQQAIQAEREGKKLDAPPPIIDIPQELTESFEDDVAFESAWHQLTPGRQRAYLMHFTGSQNSATRSNRIAKYAERILDGKGMYDCICGHSGRMPRCDGSHKKHQS